MNINSLTVDFMGQSVTLVKPQPEWQTAGDIWELATYVEAGKSAPGDSNFCAVTLVQSAGGAGGQSNWILLKQPELQLIKSVNGIKDQTDARWKWLVAPIGSVYLLLAGESEQDATQLRWPRIAIGSKADGERNLVKVIGAGMDEEGNMYARIAGIPQSADYSQYTLEKTPWFFHNIYCIYQKLNLRIGYTPQGPIYMPLFDPASGFKVSLGLKELWIDAIWLKRQINT